jgi:hypothetical protein
MLSYCSNEAFTVTGHFRRFLALSARERRTLLRAALAVASARIALWILPFRRVCGFVRRRAVNTNIREDVPVIFLEWSVRAVARRIPMASCLTQALALQWLLTRAGHRASLYIGVAKGHERGFEAHAWVESRGEILLGSTASVGGFARIITLLPQEQ